MRKWDDWKGFTFRTLDRNFDAAGKDGAKVKA